MSRFRILENSARRSERKAPRACSYRGAGLMGPGNHSPIATLTENCALRSRERCDIIICFRTSSRPYPPQILGAERQPFAALCDIQHSLLYCRVSECVSEHARVYRISLPTNGISQLLAIFAYLPTSRPKRWSPQDRLKSYRGLKFKSPNRISKV